MFSTATPLALHWKEKYEEIGALWTHSGNDADPHAEFTSEMHSGGYFNSGILAQNPMLLEAAARDLVDMLIVKGLSIEDVDRVVGPAMGAITLAHEVARIIGIRRGRVCLTAYAEKAMVSGQKNMRFSRGTFSPEERILRVEDVISTGGSLKLMTTAIVRAGGLPLNLVAALVNGTTCASIEGSLIAALIEHRIQNWSQDRCPYCKRGSSVIKEPKKRWDELLCRKS